MFAITYKKLFLLFGLSVSVAALAVIAGLGVRFGIDFTGGSLLEVQYETAPDKSLVEAAVEPLAFGGVSVRESGQTDDGQTVGYMIRTRALTDDERITLEAVVLPLGEEGVVERFTSVGPTIGAELVDKAWWAIGLVSFIIILYVAYAFAGIGTPVNSWVYGGITILILLHDILMPTAMMALLGYFVGAEIDVLFVMALLAVLGYSVNDTIVVFDRVRENIKANRTETVTTVVEPGGITLEEKTYTLTKPFSEIVGAAVSQSMARSINTSLTTIVTLAALYFFGGTLTQTFALVLMVGVLAGTYSSIILASPMLVAYAEWQDRRRPAAPATDESLAAHK